MTSLEHPAARPFLEPLFTQSPLLTLALAMAAGVALPRYFPSRSMAVVCAIVSGILLVLIANRSALRLKLITGLVVAAFLCTGVVLSIVDAREPASTRVSRMCDQGLFTVGEPVELTGSLIGQPERAPQSFYLTLEIERIAFRGVEREASGAIRLLAPMRDERVRQEYDELELRYGARVRIMTTLDRDEGFHNPGVLPLTEYLERQGYDGTGVIKSPLLIERLDDRKVFLPLAWMYSARERLGKEFAATFSSETAGVLDAALLGNRYNISRGAAERFRAGGTFHVLVISGLQIAFIGGLLILITRRLTRNRVLQFGLAAICIWGYAIAVGADPSVTRSALMFTLVILSPVIWRRANSLNIVGAAALALLVWRPANLFDPSFQLTFFSVLSIILISVPIIRELQRIGSWRPTRETPYPPLCAPWLRALAESLFWSERNWRQEMAASNVSYRLFKAPLAERLERWHLQSATRFSFTALVVSISVQIGLLPLMVVYFHRLSIASLALNILVGVLMAAVTFAALAAILTSQVSPTLAKPLIHLTEKIDWLMIHMVDPFSRFKVASLRLPHYSGRGALVYVFYYLLLGFLVTALMRWNPLRSIANTHRKTFSDLTSRCFMLIFANLTLLILFHPLSAGRPDGKLHLDFLDVGQGDSALLTMPDGTTLLVDGGGRPAFNQALRDNGEDDPAFERDSRSIGESVVSEYLWSRGLDHVDYILATHADADHIDGLNDVARNFRVRSAFVARTPEDDSEYKRFAATMSDAGVPIERIGAGDVLLFGGLSAQVLWPTATQNTAAPSRNNDSILLVIRYDKKAFLLTGDIEKAGEAAVLAEALEIKSDVVKVAHHGSRTSSTEAFVAATRPAWAIISVGRTSMFGHPHPDVVERWRASGAEVLTTGLKGTISVVTDGRTVQVSTFLP